MSSTRRIVAKNSAVILAARVIDILFSFGQVALVTRYLAPERYGDFAWIWAYILVFQPAVNFETDKIIIRNVAQQPQKASSILGSVLWIKWALMLVFIGLALGIAPFFTLDRAMMIAVVVAVFSELFQHHFMTFNGIFNAFQRMEYDTLLTAASRTTIIAAIIIVFITDAGFIALFIAIAAGSVLKGTLALIFTLKRFCKPDLSFNIGMAKAILKDAAPLTLAAFFTHAAFKADVFLLKALKDSTEVALFNLPHVLVMNLQVLPLAFVGALFPVFSRMHLSDPRRLGYIFKRVFLALSFAGLVIAVVLYLLSEWIILLVSGAQYLMAADALRIICWSVVFLFWNFLISTTLISIGKQYLIPISSFLVLASKIAIDLALIPCYGFLGAAIGTVASYGIGSVTLYIIISIVSVREGSKA